MQRIVAGVQLCRGGCNGNLNLQIRLLRSHGAFHILPISHSDYFCRDSPEGGMVLAQVAPENLEDETCIRASSVSLLGTATTPVSSRDRKGANRI
jgi:hypothetical protein